MTPALAASFGAISGLAIWASLAVVFPGAGRVGSGDRGATGQRGVTRWAAGAPWARIAATGAAGAAIWWWTGWPVAAAGAAALAWFAPVLFGGEIAHKAELARIDAIAAWAESLRDVIAAAAGLEQAVQRSAAHPPPAIRAEVERLAADIREGLSLEAALARFAAGLDDETADLVAMALGVASRQAGNLAPVLDELARTARAEAAMRSRVHTMRSRVRSAARLITGSTVAMLVVLRIVAGDYLSTYGTIAGGIVLAGALALYAFGPWWLHRLATPTPTPSFLRPDPAEPVKVMRS